MCLCVLQLSRMSRMDLPDELLSLVLDCIPPLERGSWRLTCKSQYAAVETAARRQIRASLRKHRIGTVSFGRSQWACLHSGTCRRCRRFFNPFERGCDECFAHGGAQLPRRECPMCTVLFPCKCCDRMVCVLHSEETRYCFVCAGRLCGSGCMGQHFCDECGNRVCSECVVYTHCLYCENENLFGSDE